MLPTSARLLRLFSLLQARRNWSGNDLEEVAVRALIKLEQVLPMRVRRRVKALHTAIVSLAARLKAAGSSIVRK